MFRFCSVVEDIPQNVDGNLAESEFNEMGVLDVEILEDFDRDDAVLL